MNLSDAVITNPIRRATPPRAGVLNVPVAGLTSEGKVIWRRGIAYATVAKTMAAIIHNFLFDNVSTLNSGARETGIVGGGGGGIAK